MGSQAVVRKVQVTTGVGPFLLERLASGEVTVTPRELPARLTAADAQAIGAGFRLILSN